MQLISFIASVMTLHVHLSEYLACIRVRKSEDHFIYIFFLVIHQQWLMKSIFV